MKRLIVGMFLLASFAIACDSPYEDIQGIKIGCEFTGGDGFEKSNDKALSDNLYRSTKDIKFFDSVEIETNNDNKIVGVAFIKEYDITMSNMKLQEEEIIADFKKFTESLEKRWGDFDKSKAKGIFSKLNLSGTLFMRDIREQAVNKNPKSDAVGAVAVFLSFKTNDEAMMRGKPQKARFAIGYIGKSTADELQKEKESVTDGF